MAGPGERRDQTVVHVESASELLRYALASQIDRAIALSVREGGDLSRNKIALRAGLGKDLNDAGSQLSKVLAGPGAPTLMMLERLDKQICREIPITDRAGQLSSLAVRVKERPEDVSLLISGASALWTRHMLQVTLRTAPATQEEVLSRAAALLSEFRDRDPKEIQELRRDLGEHLGDLVDQLIMVAVGPPTSLNFAAQLLLGSLASYTFDQMRERLENELLGNPLGFRLWRAITKLVKLSEDEGRYQKDLKIWVRGLLRRAEVLRDDSLYPGRSLDLELAIIIPASWSPPHDDWVGKILTDRAMQPEATLRERGTAALGLWQRAFKDPGRDKTKVEQDLGALIKAMTSEPRQDIATGIEWVVATLQDVMKNDVPVSNKWPANSQPWMSHVEQAADDLDILGVESHLLASTKTLFKHTLLQNAGVYRRQAIETLAAAGQIESTSRALAEVLRLETEESWVRIRAIFALSFLQHSGQIVEDTLIEAFRHAYNNLTMVASPEDVPRAQVTEMHAVLFAIGDCFGAILAEQRAATVRAELAEAVTNLVQSNLTHPQQLHPVARALAYLLTVTAQPQPAGTDDLAKTLLKDLTGHPDPITQNTSHWALYRFRDNGSLRPLIDLAGRSRRRSRRT